MSPALRFLAFAWLVTLLALLPTAARGQARDPGEPREPPSREAVQEAVDAVFQDPELQQGAGETHVSFGLLVKMLVERLGAAYQALVAWSSALLREHPVVYALILSVLLGLLVVLLGHIAWTFSAAFRGLRGGEIDPTEAAEAAAREQRYRDLRQEARARAEAGELREGTRLLLLALLALLAERQVLLVARSWTTREVLAKLRVAPEMRETLARFGAAVEEADYSEHPVTPAGFQSCEAQLERLVRALPPRAALESLA